VTLWWVRHVREVRKERIFNRLRKACRNYVRLHRWLARVRRTLYGIEPAPVGLTDLEWALHRHKLAVPIVPRSAAPDLQFTNSTAVRQPCLFMALNTYEEPDYMGPWQRDIDFTKEVNDIMLSKWQAELTESVLFFDGRSLISARLSPKSFLQRVNHPELAPGAAGGHEGRNAITDIRHIDVSDTGLALRDSAPRCQDIVCMCQHKTQTQVFATYHETGNKIFIWKWLGTDQHEMNKLPLIPWNIIPMPAGTVVYQMCFLKETEHSDGKRCRVMVLLVGRPAEHHWLALEVRVAYEAGPAGHKLLSRMVIGEDGSLMAAVQEGNLVLRSSYSDRFVVLAGKNVLQFYEISRGQDFQLQRIPLPPSAGWEQVICVVTFVSCLCLWHRGGGGFDWIMVGDHAGNIYGLRFDYDDCQGRVVYEKCHKDSGKYRSCFNLHDNGTAVRLLLGSYGSAPSSHYKALQANGVVYKYFLTNQVKEEPSTFFSAGDDGKLLKWSLTNKIGWMSTQQPLDDSNSSLRMIAGHCSRLVPNVLVLADEKRKLLVSYADGEPVTSAHTCSYRENRGGA